jgi:hypothetical protein
VLAQLVALTLLATPWSGAGLTGSVPQSEKFLVTVAGAPGARVVLEAEGLPAGWIGSWCTDRVCAPYRTEYAIPAGGIGRVEFQIVPPGDGVRSYPAVRLRAYDGASSATVRVAAQRVRRR